MFLFCGVRQQGPRSICIYLIYGYLEEWCRAAVLHGYLGYEVSGEAEDATRLWDSGMPVRGTERFYIR